MSECTHQPRNIVDPRQGAAYIANQAKSVTINFEKVKPVADMIYKATASKKYGVANWKQHPLNPKEMTEETVEWIFVVDLLNFSFWSENYRVEYKGELLEGYWSLCASINRALEEDVPITDAAFYSTVPRSELEIIFRSINGTEIPLLNERLELLHQAGETLNKKFGGKFVNCVRACSGDAVKLLSLIIEEFPSFRDEAVYKGTTVPFYKRAQILIADLWACFEGKSYGQFHNIDELTVFADYRVPQVLVYLGVLQYSYELMDRLKIRPILDTGSEEVCEIRGVTIHACELIREAIKKEYGTVINSVLIDFFLWDYRRENARKIDDAGIPFHRTRCLYY